jgi:hypothetical protein
MCFRRKKMTLRTKSESLVKKGDTYFIDDINLSLQDLKDGIEISWNSADTEFEIIFPDGRNPFEKVGFCKRNFRRSSRRKVGWLLNPGFAKIIEKELNSGAEEVRLFYAVYCYENKSMAEGNSFPKMIIK